MAYIMAATTESVNGVPGARVRGIAPDEVVFDGAQGTFIGGDGLAMGHGPRPA